MLVNEPEEIQSMLIMEDDVRLKSGWREAWNRAHKSLPDDWDCVYLGGVLPPNKDGLVSCLERVGPGLARVAPNQLFGQSSKTRYFHFCAYAYVLSKKGAEKILKSIETKDGYWTSADHMICNRYDDMNLFVVDPLVAGASQDDDPIYKTAQFNNFSRVDNFDSDLWNNDERFTDEEIKKQLSNVLTINIDNAFLEVESEALAMPAPVPVATPVSVATPVPVATPEIKLPKHKGPKFVSLDICGILSSKMYEIKWLQDIFNLQQLNIDPVNSTDALEPYDNLVVVLIRPKWQEQLAWLEFLVMSGRKFKVIHLADEHGTDPTHFYMWPEITGVIRNYKRPNLPTDPKITIIPLGYHWQFKGREFPLVTSPELPFRENMWSFAGTDWVGRSGAMAPLNLVGPNFLKFFPDWKDANELKEEEYISLLLNSKFVPCPRGNNKETYRFYEALECGCIPICIDLPDVFNDELEIISLQSWEHAAALMMHFQKNPEQMEQYRKAVLISWANYKKNLKAKLATWLEN
jgi:hypothetical protein